MKNICSIVDYKLDALVVKSIKPIQIHPDVIMPEGTEGTISHKNGSQFYYVTFNFTDPKRKESVTLPFRGKSELGKSTKLVSDSRGQPK